VNLEIRDLQRAIELLRCSINEKEFAMKIAQTRLDERTRRLCVEVCFDEPMKGSVHVCVCVCVCVSLCSAFAQYCPNADYFQIPALTEVNGVFFAKKD